MAEPKNRDPLSIFLVVSMLLLGVMYYQDWADKQAIDAHAKVIGPLTQLDALAGCEVYPVGAGEDEALIACPGKSAEQTKEQAKQALVGANGAFEHFSFRGPQGTLRCDRLIEQCRVHPKKPRSFYQEARRRRPRTERSSPGG